MRSFQGLVPAPAPFFYVVVKKVELTTIAWWQVLHYYILTTIAKTRLKNKMGFAFGSLLCTTKKHSIWGASFCFKKYYKEEIQFLNLIIYS